MTRTRTLGLAGTATGVQVVAPGLANADEATLTVPAGTVAADDALPMPLVALSLAGLAGSGLAARRLASSRG